MSQAFARNGKRWGLLASAIAIAALLAHLVSCGSGDDCELSEMVTAVHCAALGLGGVNEGAQSDETTLNVIRWYVQPATFLNDASGYFFVLDTSGLCIAHHADPSLEGQNIYDMQDTSGKYFVRDLISAAQAGGGFVDYDCLNPTTGEVGDKISYAEMITGTDYLIGSGVYAP